MSDVKVIARSFAPIEVTRAELEHAKTNPLRLVDRLLMPTRHAIDPLDGRCGRCGRTIEALHAMPIDDALRCGS